MSEIFDIIRAVNQLKDIIQRFTLKLDRLLKKQVAPLPDLLYDETTVCSILHCSYRSILALRNSGALPYIRIKRRVLYPCSEVLKYVKIKSLPPNSS
jgi:hypothetical protein